MAVRTLSQSEVSRALDCQASWDFRYGGHLAGGDALRSKMISPKPSGGKAWGAAMQAYDAAGDVQLASEAIGISLEEDADKLREAGLYHSGLHRELSERVNSILLHHVSLVPPAGIEPDVEHEIVVPIPARTGRGPSSRYRFIAYLDAYRVTDSGGVWLREYKLRGQLTPAKLIQLSRQIRWYSWAWRERYGSEVLGVEVVERLNEVPKPPRMVLAPGQKRSDPGARRVPSHAADQMCTAEDYLAVCREHDVEPSAEALEAMRARKWHQTVPITFRRGELDEAGRELVSAARLVQQLDAGLMDPPLRNAGRQCNWCDFAEICPAPDQALIDELFDRTTPKRLKEAATHDNNDNKGLELPQASGRGDGTHHRHAL